MGKVTTKYNLLIKSPNLSNLQTELLPNPVLFKNPTFFSKPILRIEKGRLLIVKKCKKNWCRVKTQNFLGWVKTNEIWGLY